MPEKTTTLRGLAKRIMEHAEALPEASPICPGALLHLGSRAAVGQALSRLVRSGHLMRIFRGVYMRPIYTKYGVCAPWFPKVVEALAELWGEIIVPNGGAAANNLRLTTQVPMRLVYLTSGPSRRLQVGSSEVVLRHAPRWQLVAPNRKAGRIVRALDWLGRAEVEDHLDTIMPTLTEEERRELADTRAVLPTWMAEALSARLAAELGAPGQDSSGDDDKARTARAT